MHILPRKAIGVIEPARFANSRAMSLAGIRRHHTFGDSAHGIPAQWRELGPLLPMPGQRGRTAYGVICTASPEEQTLEYMCAVEVESFDALPAGTGRLRVPVGHYAVFVHEGNVATIRATWDAILGDWLPRSGRRTAQRPDLEVYGERFDPATGDGGIEIWFPIEPEESPLS